MNQLVSLRDVTKTYPGPVPVPALNGVSLDLGDGELLAVHGRSGSGKTTLLNIIGGLDRADSGEVMVCGADLAAAGDQVLTELRRHRVSFVFQSFGLLPVLSAAENVEVPLRLVGTAVAERRRRVGELLDMVGLSGRARHRPAQLSGGEQQRVAIARSMVRNPTVLLADEPTGALDVDTGGLVMDMLQDVVAQFGTTLVTITHDLSVAARADRQFRLDHGVLTTLTAAELPAVTARREVA